MNKLLTKNCFRNKGLLGSTEKLNTNNKKVLRIHLAALSLTPTAVWNVHNFS